PRGLAALRASLANAQDQLAALRARPDRLNKLPEAATERDIRYIEARLRSAILIDPANQPLTEAAFGLCITVADRTGTATTYQITGEDEADPARHRIAPQSPLARALIGNAVGDSVIWQRPSGSVTLTLTAITQPEG
ncbi:MAG: GreA/GreB family elongation factor, partial [Paracoccaceae bacterium]|nr:GreA/GreB family elongation factor [Paracoccaceae bacterium]